MQETTTYNYILSTEQVFRPGLKMVVHNIPSIPKQWNVIEYHKLTAVAVCRNCIPLLQKSTIIPH